MTGTYTNPKDLRAACRNGEFRSPTSGHAPGFVQANLVILPQEFAYDFLLYCQRNPKPCPLLEVLDTGSPIPRQMATDSDIRTDLPLYRVYENGQLVAEETDITARWRDDYVGFLLGCSFTFEAAMMAVGLPMRHLEETLADGTPKNVPMYRTNRRCRNAGRFSGPLVVSMRPIPEKIVDRAVEITREYPFTHGGPVYWGDPQLLGIDDISKPDWGDPVTIKPGEVPVFWACGVTPQAAILEIRPPLCITHSPGHMFVADVRDAELSKVLQDE